MKSPTRQHGGKRAIRRSRRSVPGDVFHDVVACICGRTHGGVLIYTAAPDSEGTLGGLVSLGETEALDRHIKQALECLAVCASDPLCAETQPDRAFLALHGSACHNCLFLPETSCERGNRYLDRSVLVNTLERAEFAFFRP